MSKSCKGMLEDMLKCVEETDCVKKGNTLTACVKDGKPVSYTHLTLPTTPYV